MAPRRRPTRHPGQHQALCLALAASWLVTAPVWALAQSPGSPARAPATRTLDILEFVVEGAAALDTIEVETVLEPFLGPGRPLETIENARAALEKHYAAKGYQSVAVAVPPQTVRYGVVHLTVTEGRVERLRVHGSRYYSIREIKRLAPSVAEGRLPDFNALVGDILRLNQLPDRRVTPAIRNGDLPGTVDVDLQVEDTLPLHGSIEYNNRSSAGTTPSRLNAALRYDNLWQAGHTLAFSAQIAPQRLKDGEVYSASYTARFADSPWLTLSANGVIQDSDISTLGSIAVRGRGQIYGGRAAMTLPGSVESFFHSVVVGADAKRFHETITLGTGPLDNPVQYYPLTAQYGAAWSSSTSQTSLGLTAVVNLRGVSSTEARFDSKRYNASGSFAYGRLEFSRTQEAPGGFQGFARLSSQLSPDPLISSEQIVAGGVDSVRGYLEGVAAGDEGGFGTLELRSPVLSGFASRRVIDEWRLHAFVDGAVLAIRGALPDQQARFRLSSVGGGTRLHLFEHLSGALDIAVPLATVGPTHRGHVRFHMRFVGEF
jgi:hemolysin activation/secretion protein